MAARNWQKWGERRSSRKPPLAARNWQKLRDGRGCRELALAAKVQQKWGKRRGCHKFLLADEKVRKREGGGGAPGSCRDEFHLAVAVAISFSENKYWHK
jgi:hypothetical protein